MTVFDLESFRDYFLTLMKTDLNGAITAISVEKADSIPLASFVDAQYTGDLNEKVMNYETFVYYYFPQIETIENAGAGGAMDIAMAFDIVFTQIEGGTLAETQLMRYTRALKDVIENKSANMRADVGDISVQEFAPTVIMANKTSQWIKVAGVTIKGTIG